MSPRFLGAYAPKHDSDKGPNFFRNELLLASRSSNGVLGANPNTMCVGRHAPCDALAGAALWSTVARSRASSFCSRSRTSLMLPFVAFPFSFLSSLSFCNSVPILASNMFNAVPNSVAKPFIFLSSTLSIFVQKSSPPGGAVADGCTGAVLAGEATSGTSSMSSSAASMSNWRLAPSLWRRCSSRDFVILCLTGTLATVEPLAALPLAVVLSAHAAGGGGWAGVLGPPSCSAYPEVLHHDLVVGVLLRDVDAAVKDEEQDGDEEVEQRRDEDRGEGVGRGRRGWGGLRPGCARQRGRGNSAPGCPFWEVLLRLRGSGLLPTGRPSARSSRRGMWPQRLYQHAAMNGGEGGGKRAARRWRRGGLSAESGLRFLLGAASIGMSSILSVGDWAARPPGGDREVESARASIVTCLPAAPTVATQAPEPALAHRSRPSLWSTRSGSAAGMTAPRARQPADGQPEATRCSTSTAGRSKARPSAPRGRSIPAEVSEAPPGEFRPSHRASSRRGGSVLSPGTPPDTGNHRRVT